jgi:hypothetical protein
MLDFNHRASFGELVTHLVDAGLEAEHRATLPRSYLGGSRLGVPCDRALQFEYAQEPKDQGAEFEGRTLRIFAAGHVFEDLAVRWLRSAGFDLYTRKGNRPDGEQFGFSVAGGRIRGHVDGIVAGGPPDLAMRYPALWECKSLNAKSWSETARRGVVASKPLYAAQIAIYQAYMEATVRGISESPALFTAVNKDTAELHHELVPFDAALAQRLSDRAVNILRATEAHELLPRIATSPDHFECQRCPWARRCWSLQP